MKSSQQPTGMIIPVALLIAMVVFMTATALLGQSRLNLQFSGEKARESRRLFLAQGAVNEFIDNLSSDLSLLSSTEAAPFTGTWQDISYEVWIESDPVDPDIHHVRAKAFPTGNPNKAVFCESVVQSGPDFSPQIATNVPDQDIDNPDPVFFGSTTTTSWSKIKPLGVRRGWSKQGNYVEGEGQAGTLVFCGGNSNGKLYFIYAPALDGGLNGKWENLNSLGQWQPMGEKQMRSGMEAAQCLIGVVSGHSHGIGGGTGLFNSAPQKTLAGLVRIAQWVVEDLADTEPGLSTYHDAPIWVSFQAALFEYEIATETWRQLPPLENHELEDGVFKPQNAVWSDGSVVDGPYRISGLPGPIACDERYLYVPLYKKGPDLVARLDLVTEVWTILPPVLDRNFQPTDISYVATTGKDLYVMAYPYQSGGAFPNFLPPTEPPQIFRLNDDGSAWEDSLPEVTASQVKDGVLIESSEIARDLGCMAAGPEGALYVVGCDEKPNTIFKFAGGRWTAMAGPSCSSSDSAEANFPDIGVDSAGTLVLRSPNDDGPDEMFRVRNSEYRPLPPLPDGVGYSAQMIGGAILNSSATVFRAKASY
ncbi:MAG: hypothetical protein WC423_05870 [Vulcanimicrobiota bacterium]